MTSDRLYVCSSCTRIETRRYLSLRPPVCCGKSMEEIAKASSDYGFRAKVRERSLEHRYGVERQ